MSKRNFIVVMLACLTICMTACSQKTDMGFGDLMIGIVI